MILNKHSRGQENAYTSLLPLPKRITALQATEELETAIAQSLLLDLCK